MNRRLLWIAMGACALGNAAFAPSANATDAACKPVFDAMVKVAATPNHQFTTHTAEYNTEVEKGEVITTGTMVYVKAAGIWHAHPYDPQKQATELRQALTTENLSCQHVRDETITGEQTSVYGTQDHQEDGTTVNSQFWISKTRGLPLKQTIDDDVGGKHGKSHMDVRIEYTNVQPPAGVH